MGKNEYFATLRNQLLAQCTPAQAADVKELTQVAKLYVWQNNELKTCILAAQAYDQEAINKLCACFEPLIIKAVNLTVNESQLNYQDTLHYAWECFLDVVMKYESKNYDTFPGYVLLRIYSRLQRLRFNNNRQSFNESISMDDENAAQLAGPNNINQFIDNSSLSTAMGHISPREKEILQQSYIQQRRTADIAKDLRLSESRVRHIKQDALSTLNNLLS